METEEHQHNAHPAPQKQRIDVRKYKNARWDADRRSDHERRDPLVVVQFEKSASVWL
jgi:hypothetical protein